MTINLYFIEPCKWAAEDGSIRTAHAYSVHDVEENVAQKAISVGAAILMTDSRISQYVGLRGIQGYHTPYHPKLCVDLDQLRDGETLASLRASSDPRVQRDTGALTLDEERLYGQF
jgi:hypothetical protein